MKKIIFILAISLLLSLLTLTAYAQEVKEENNGEIITTGEGAELSIKDYITEKILPILVSSVSGIVGLISCCVLVKRSANGLGNRVNTALSRTKGIEDECKKEVTKISNQLLEIKDEGEKIVALGKTIESLKNELNALIMECHNVARMVTLGAMGDERAMRDGRASKILKLLEKNGQMLEQIGVKTDTYGRILEKNEVNEGEKA